MVILALIISILMLYSVNICQVVPFGLKLLARTVSIIITQIETMQPLT